MVWAALALLAVGCSLGIVFVGRRSQRTGTVALERAPQFDFIRSGLTALASALALLTGATAFADYSIESNPFTGGFFMVVGVIAAALALYPARGLWGRSRRLGATALAAVWAVIGVIGWPFFVMASACGCGGGWNGSPAPTPLGMDARGWIVLAVIAGPTLLLLVVSGVADLAYARLRGRAPVGSPH
jgi:hypothetical protein